MMILYVKGDTNQALNAAVLHGLDPIGVKPYPRNDWKMSIIYVRPGPGVYDWHGEGPGKGPYPPGTLLWFKHCD